MNDCVWCFIGICDCENGRCAGHLDANDAEGSEIALRYEHDVNEAIEEIQEDWSVEFGYHMRKAGVWKDED